MATSEGIPSSIDIEFLELNDNPYNKSISKRRFSKVLLTFADELLIASLQISVYWLSGSDVILL